MKKKLSYGSVSLGLCASFAFGFAPGGQISQNRTERNFNKGSYFPFSLEQTGGPKSGTTFPIDGIAQLISGFPETALSGTITNRSSGGTQLQIGYAAGSHSNIDSALSAIATGSRGSLAFRDLPIGTSDLSREFVPGWRPPSNYNAAIVLRMTAGINQPSSYTILYLYHGNKPTSFSKFPVTSSSPEVGGVGSGTTRPIDK